MGTTVISRRAMLDAAALTLVAAVGVPRVSDGKNEPPLKSEETVRRYYTAWETKAWPPIDALLADDFTFSSPLDDHISKSAFKTRCWDTQVGYIDRFDLQQLIGSGDEAFVMYACHTVNGKIFRNVEYFRFRDGKVMSVECYFGGKSSFPSAVSTGQS